MNKGDLLYSACSHDHRKMLLKLIKNFHLYFEQSIERTDDNYQIDDVFMSRAAGMQSEAKMNEREKLASVLGRKY